MFMVFLKLLNLPNFIPMKTRYPSLAKVLFLAIIVSSSFKTYGQDVTEITDCPTNAISGNIHVHLSDCVDGVIIKGNTGATTYVSGYIKNTNSIKILPGESSTRILYASHVHQSGNPAYRHRSKGTDMGGNGDTDDRTEAKEYDYNSIVMYPNPTREHINFSTFKNDIIGYQIVSAQGVVLYDGQFKSDATTYRISVTDLSPGYYVVNIMLKNGETLTKLLVKE